jgi:membrane protein implicated in regulation of membrane protease activity
MFPFSEQIELFPKAERGVIETSVSCDTRGRVKARATSWFAEFYSLDCQMTVPAGNPVRIVARRGNTLLVLPYSS